MFSPVVEIAIGGQWTWPNSGANESGECIAQACLTSRYLSAKPKHVSLCVNGFKSSAFSEWSEIDLLFRRSDEMEPWEGNVVICDVRVLRLGLTCP